MPFLHSRVDSWSQMGLFGTPRAIILKPFRRCPCRVGSSGRSGDRKVWFWINFSYPLAWFCSLLNYFGDIFQSDFCMYEVVWMSCLQGSFLHCVTWYPLYLSTLQYNSLTCKKTDRAEKRSSGSSRDGFLVIHEATTFCHPLTAHTTFYRI